MNKNRTTLMVILAVAWLLPAIGCGGSAESGNNHSKGHGGPGGGPPHGDRAKPTAAVPVEVAEVERRDISSFIETNGVLEAEKEVDIVGRVSAPIVELLVEEGMLVKKGQLLARLDEVELRAQLEIARVELKESKLSYDRAEALQKDQLISSEQYEQAQARYETAQARVEGNEILLGYTKIAAPFEGLIVNRYVDFAEQVSVNSPLFRLSNFNPLLCPIQVPERDLSKLRIGQRAHLTVESWPDERFEASVLRISPVVDASSGTLKVTLEVNARKKLRPGMFARVYIETATRAGVLVIPKTALSLESIGETVYIIEENVARRREVSLGFQEGDFVEVASGLAAGDTVIVVGQDGLSDGTPVKLLGGAAPEEAAGGKESTDSADPAGHRMDPSSMTPEQIEAARERMRSRGLSEEEINKRLEGHPQKPPAKPE